MGVTECPTAETVECRVQGFVPNARGRENVALHCASGWSAIQSNNKEEESRKEIDNLSAGRRRRPELYPVICINQEDHGKGQQESAAQTAASYP